MKTFSAFLLLCSVVWAAPPTEGELLDLLNAFDARTAELPDGQPKTDITTASVALRTAIQGLPDDPPPEPLWTTIDLPEGRKIVTHLGLIPDLSADVTHTLTSGPFPQDLPVDARVLIPAGVTVEIDAAINNRVESIAVQGTLKFSRAVPTHLRVGTILVYPAGKYDHGNETSPIQVSSTVIFDGHVNTAFDPEQITNGLIAFGGEVSICGDFITGTASTELAAPVAAGGTTFTVQDANGWNVGDEILLVDSQKTVDPSKYKSQRETRYITGLDLNQVTVFPALTYQHDGIVDDITRNVRYDSATEGDRGHVILMAHTHAHVCCCRLDNLGRTSTSLLNDTIRNPDRTVLQLGTNQRGRYPLHAHHLTVPHTFDRVVTFNTPAQNVKWAITHHNSHGTISNCITIDAAGAGIVGEAGTETGLHIGNSVHHGATFSAGQQPADYLRFQEKDVLGRFVDDRGFSGFGYWYRGPFIEVKDCKASGRFVEAFSWDVESGGMTNTFTLPAIEGRPPELIGVPFDLATTPLRSVDGCYGDVVGNFLGIWGGNEVDYVLRNIRMFHQSYFSGGVALLHNGGGSLTLEDCELLSDPQTNDTAVVVLYTTNLLRLVRTAISGWPMPVVDQHIQAIEIVE